MIFPKLSLKFEYKVTKVFFSIYGVILFALFIHVIWPHYSGHYRPNEENLLKFLTCMGKNGFDIVDIEIFV